MAEISFARQFLSALESRPIKLPSDHVADPRSFPAQSPYSLPKMPRAKRKRKYVSEETTSGASGITVTLKALKSEPLILKSQPPTISTFELKTAFASHFSVPVEKVRLLKDKKPVPDSKILKELAADNATEIEFSIVLLPGATLSVPKATPSPAIPSASTPGIGVPEPVNEAGEVEAQEISRQSGHDELRSEGFWDDLKGYLIQRLRDQEEGVRVAKIFRAALDSHA